MYEIIFYTFGMLFFGVFAGVCFALMGFELNRKGRPTQYLSLSFDPRVRIHVARTVFENYRQLKRDENRSAVLPWLVWASLALFILFVMLYVIALLT
jgi:hypothetical protein